VRQPGDRHGRRAEHSAAGRADGPERTAAPLPEAELVIQFGRRPLWLSILMYGILTLTSLVILYPLVFMIFSTFTSTEAYYRTAFFPIPDTFDFHNYQAILADCSQGCITKSILITAARAVWY